ncbi:hypothetical protein V6N13_148290 [Hibiscus sabdariffa]
MNGIDQITSITGDILLQCCPSLRHPLCPKDNETVLSLMWVMRTLLIRKHCKMESLIQKIMHRVLCCNGKYKW